MRLLLAALLVIVLPLPSIAEDVRGRQVLGDLLKQLSSADEAEALKASLALPEIVTAEDFLTLVQALPEVDTERGQIAIIRGLAGIGDARAAKLIHSFTIQGAEPVQIEALLALGKLKHNWAVPALTTALLERRSALRLRFAAAIGLGLLGTREAIYALEQAGARLEQENVKYMLGKALALAKNERDTEAVDPVNPAGERDIRRYKGVDYRFYHPTVRPRDGSKPRLLACFHSFDLDWDRIFALCQTKARDAGLAALVVHFDFLEFPNFDRFNIPGRRADKFFLELADFLAEEADVESREMYLFGVGAGGGFVQRFAMAYPRRIARAYAVSGDFMPFKSDRLFPDGLRTSPVADDIQIDLYDFAKQETKLVYAANENLLWGSAQAKKALEEYARSKGITTRYEIADSGRFRGSAVYWRDAEEYLFWVKPESGPPRGATRRSSSKKQLNIDRIR